MDGLEGMIQPKPVEVSTTKPGDKSKSAGTHPLYRDYTLDPGDELTEPTVVSLINSEDPAEALENLGAVALAVVKNWPSSKKRCKAESTKTNSNVPAKRLSNSLGAIKVPLLKVQ